MEGRQRRPSSVRRRAERSKVIRSNQYVAMYYMHVQTQLKDKERAIQYSEEEYGELALSVATFNHDQVESTALNIITLCSIKHLF